MRWMPHHNSSLAAKGQNVETNSDHQIQQSHWSESKKICLKGFVMTYEIW
jgi:hypothetical protein